ncbi:MAG: sulfatase [Bacteroidota bacterium]
MMSTVKLFFLFLIPGVLLSTHAEAQQEKQRPNILLIAIDDLRPELGCYGANHIKSPNIDLLASEGVLFNKAYTQQAVCAPSRNTLMTGLRPDALGIHDLGTFFRTKAPDVITLSQFFMQNGYHAEGMGKIYHTGHGNQNDALSWSSKHWNPNRIVNKRLPINSGDTTKLETCYPRVRDKKIAWYNSPMPEAMHNDALTTTHAIERMKALKDSAFFLAVGLQKPHLPFVAPQKFWDLYDQDQLSIPEQTIPTTPSYAFTNWGELRKYHAMPSEGPMKDAYALNLIHGYYACVSFIDAQVGRLVEKLKQLDLYDNTIIVIWGDHGYKLGDYGSWCKHTNFEIDTRVPVIIRAPQKTAVRGINSDAIIETVDIYPTLCALAGFEEPNHLQGSSFMEAMFKEDFTWEEVAISQYPRRTKIDNKNIPIMGYSMRTSQYRFTKWINRTTGETLANELYDHSNPGLEMVNLAEHDKFNGLLKKLDSKFEETYQRVHQ